MAPTRTGKGVGIIIPNLLTANRSVICIDPKGDNAKIAGRARNRFGPVHVIDPFSVTGIPSAAFNPLAMLDPASLDIAEEAATLAEALVYDVPSEAGDAHWNEEAKALITGLLLCIVAEEPQERRTLSTLRDYLTITPAAFMALLTRMQGMTAAGGLIARAANRHIGKADREASGVLSAAQRHTDFLDSPHMTAVLNRSDFALGDLKSRIATVFLVLPPDRLGIYARWLRLMVIQSLQDIHQLRAIYGQRAGTFLSNACALQVFGVYDHDSAHLVSDLLGQETVVLQTMSHTLDSEKLGLSFSDQHTGWTLVTPDEVGNLPQGHELLFLAGLRPIIADKLRYYDDPEFAGSFDPVLKAAPLVCHLLTFREHKRE